MGLGVLHISNAFAQSALYKHLAVALDSWNVQQTVYSAVRTQKEADHDPPELNHLDIHICNILKPYDRLFFRNKIRKISKDIFHQVDLSSIDVIHAHTLYSDGATALRIKNKTGIPYIAAVRSTDLNAFEKYRPDLKRRRNEVLNGAEKIVFLSPAHRSSFLGLLDNPMKTVVETKMITIPNGIDPLFLESPSFNEKKSSMLKLLYVGDFIERKNVVNLIKAIKVLSKTKSVELNLVGGGGEDEAEIKQMIASEAYPFVNYLGRIKDREELRQIYRSNDIFIMVSNGETFGLVYIEALSQGLPIIYTKGEGVDGYFEEGDVAEAVHNPADIEEIANKINVLAEQLDKSLQKKCIKQAQRFDWKHIAVKYKELYNAALGS